MKIYLEDEVQFFETHTCIYKQVERVIEKTLQIEEVPYPVEVSLTVVGKADIQQINKEHRNIDKATDVLSFPQIDAVANGQIPWQDMDINLYMNLDTKEVILGDIVLCDEVAKEQASAYNHSLEREVCFLVAHSMLHLLGYDHMTPEEEHIMIDKQNQILESLNIQRA